MKRKNPEIGSLEYAQEVVTTIGIRELGYENGSVLTGLAVNLASNVVGVSENYQYPFTVVTLRTPTQEFMGISKYNPADKKLGQPWNKKSGYCIALARAARQYIRRAV